MALSLFGRLPFGLILGAIICLQLDAAPQPPQPPHGDGDHNGDNRCRPHDSTPNAVDSAGGSSCRPAKVTPQIPLTGGSAKWKWDPASKSHPCNIHRVSKSELLRSYGSDGLPNLYPRPLVIYPDGGGGDDDETSRFANMTTSENLPSNFPPDFRVTLTGSDSLSSHRRTVPLAQYLREVATANGGSGETLPNQLGNETWYLFGETFSDEWDAFLRSYEPLPPCTSCTPSHRERGKIALSFGVGNIGSGVQWHLHGPGFSETVHGRKHWVLYPPRNRPEYDLDYASRHWMENAYPALEGWSDEDVRAEKRKHEDFLRRWKKGSSSVEKRRDAGKESEERGPSGRKPWECTINRGEMIYFPDQWHHATINLEKYTVFVSSFTTEHEG